MNPFQDTVAESSIPAIEAVGESSEKKNAEPSGGAGWDFDGLLQEVLEKSSDGIFLLSLHGTVVGWNPSLEAMTSTPREAVLGKPFSHFFSFDEKVVSLIWSVHHGSQEVRFQFKSKNQTDQQFLATVSATRDRSGKVAGVWGKVEKAANHFTNPLETVDLSRLLCESSNDAICLLDPNGVMISMNPAFEKITGWSISEWVGRHFAELAHPDELMMAVEIFQKALKAETIPIFETRVRCASGEFRRVEHNLRTILRSGSVFGILLISRDVTEKKIEEENKAQLSKEQVARAIAEANEERHRLLTNAIPHIIWTMDRSGSVEFFNNQGKAYAGSAIEGQVWPFRRWVHRDDRRSAWAAWRKGLLHSVPTSVECRLRGSSDSRFRWHLAKIVPMQKEKDQVVKWLGVCIDIDDQKRAEQALRISEIWFQGMLNTAPVMLWLSDSTAALTFFNSQWVKFTGRPVKADLGFGWKENIHPDDLESCMQTYLENFNRQHEYRAEYRMKRHDGNFRWILEAGVPRYGSGGDFLGYIGSCIDITDQKETEAKLRHSEERYRLVARSTNDTIWDWDLVTHQVNRSDSCRYFWGDQLEATGSMIHSWYQSIHPEDRERVWRSIQDTIEKGRQKWAEEYRHQRSDGTYAYVQDRGHLLYDSGGRPLRMIGAMTDITERRRAEEKLQRSEMRYRLAARATSHAIWEWDLTTNRIHWSDAVMTTFHYKVEELGPFAEWWYEHVHPDDRKRVVEGIHRVIEQGEQHWSDEYRFLCGNNQYKNVIDRGFVVHDANGRAVRMIGAMMDITERMEAEAESRRFKFISDNSNDAHFLIDEKGNVLYANNVACGRLGYLREELLHQPIDRIDCSISDSGQFFKRFVRDEKPEPLLFESEHTDKHGARFPVEVSAVLVKFEGQSHIFMVARDITERKRAEHELKMQADELARSNAELQQFAYVASHDLQEPLRMVNSYLTLLARKYGDALDKDAHEYIRFAVDGALRMHALINDLLVYSRVGTRDKHVQKVDLNAVFEGAIANLKPAIAESGAEVVRGELPQVMADKVQMTQLFQNLLGNAIKFRREVAPKVSVDAVRRSSEWIISIRDNGIGIDPKFINRIFIIFQRLHTRDEYPGTGIGLAICKKIVERHDGRIWAEPGDQGTTFRFSVKAV